MTETRENIRRLKLARREGKSIWTKTAKCIQEKQFAERQMLLRYFVEYLSI